jgi:hypothetical protein
VLHLSIDQLLARSVADLEALALANVDYAHAARKLRGGREEEDEAADDAAASNDGVAAAYDEEASPGEVEDDDDGRASVYSFASAGRGSRRPSYSSRRSRVASSAYALCCDVRSRLAVAHELSQDRSPAAAYACYSCALAPLSSLSSTRAGSYHPSGWRDQPPLASTAMHCAASHPPRSLDSEFATTPAVQLLDSASSIFVRCLCGIARAASRRPGSC